MQTRALLPALALVAALAIAACGGDDNPDATSGNGSASKPPAAVLDRIDLAQSVQTLQQLQSFRFDLTMKLDFAGSAGSTGDPMADAFAAALVGIFSDISLSGSFVEPDQAEVSMKFLGQDVGLVLIGDRAWLKEPGGAWTAVPLGSLDSFGFGSPEDLIADLVPEEVLRGAKTTRERVNGVDTVRYSFDKASLARLAEDLGEDFAELATLDTANLDVWLTDGNIPVKLSMKMAGADASGQKMSMSLDLNIRDINDSSIKISPPIR